MAERIVFVEQKVRFRIDIGGARDLGINQPVFHRDRSFENAADDALLTPYLAGLQLAVGIEARELRAGAGAAGRAVVRAAGAEHEILAVRAGIGRRTEQLDVVDFAPVRSTDAVPLKRPADVPRARRQLFQTA